MISYAELKNRRASAILVDPTKGVTKAYGIEKKIATSEIQEVWSVAINAFTTLPVMKHPKLERILVVISGKVFLQVGKKSVNMMPGQAQVITKNKEWTIGTYDSRSEIMFIQPVGYLDKLRVTGDVATFMKSAIPEYVEQIADLSEKKYVPLTSRGDRRAEIDAIRNWMNQSRKKKIGIDGKITEDRPTPSTNPYGLKQNEVNRFAQYLNPDTMRAQQNFEAEVERVRNTPPPQPAEQPKEATVKVEEVTKSEPIPEQVQTDSSIAADALKMSDDVPETEDKSVDAFGKDF